jgi:CheY-like chemotaxis protein
MPAETILLVEDNPVNQKLLLVVLQPHGYRLITARDGEEAVNLAMRERPHLILMDLQLPKMNGFAATRILKNQDETARIPVVALTAHTLPEEWRKVEDAGFSGFITKPINTRAFPSQIRQFLDDNPPD